MKESETRALLDTGRQFLKANWDRLETVQSDQDRGRPVPGLQKPAPAGARRVKLVAPGDFAVGAVSVLAAMRSRRSRRRYGPGPLTLEELSFLLWATQGVREKSGRRTLRTVPSAGARHTFETNVFAARVNGCEPGLYRYQPLDHALVLLEDAPDLARRMDDALLGQLWGAAAVFAWTTVPYRMEWRYSVVSGKLIALDAGHVCQSLYLACEATGCGTCAIGAYDQEKLDALLGVDGQEEFAVYAAPVGRAVD